MSSGPNKNGPSLRLGGVPANNSSVLFERLNVRTSTPDSEALASSDDDAENKDTSVQQIQQPQKPVRRASWLNETSQTLSRPRKESFASSSMSPTTSHPSTPSTETGGGAWGSHSATSIMNRPAGASTFSWGTGIWNTERKDAPARLSEVLPSPTSSIPPGATANSFFGTDVQAASPAGSREPAPNPQIPFAIPLHPTPKTYRSQSYSVGQLDAETTVPAAMSSSAMLGRARVPGLQHRPSRPSMLSEMANDGSMLGQLKEAEDDDDQDSAPSSLQGSIHQSNESKTIEMLTRENAMLRQQQQQYTARIRPRAGTGSYLGNGYGLRESVPEESDFAIDELEEANESGEALAQRAMNRRMSEFGPASMRSPFAMDNHKTDNTNLKKALWSSSLGFSVGDVSQSRRHSFATMPTRHGSISSLTDSAAALEAAPANEGQLQSPEYPPGYTDASGFPPGNNAYFAGGAAPFPPSFANPNQYASTYSMSNHPYSNRAPSPHRSLYGIAQPRHNQLLHIVLFKCARADVFYIQEGTGLTVKPGDLVIVEADRGTDLGTVAKDNVDWPTAKDLKEHYAEEQYKWLMMYSQGAAAAQDGVGAGLLASSTGFQGSAVGGMGPPGQHHMQEPSAGELRPKLIKRLAQSHEIHALRDKEGQEAKAKRVCMQKVKEHGLHMEILDAEFQMDWKKLTFYYFADNYINFNSLVTDLFKIYKTRIWMSAINPASFASPTLGIQAPSGIGPGAVGVGRAATTASDRRQGHQQAEQVQPQASYAARANRGGPVQFNQPFIGERSVAPAGGYPPSYPYGQYGAFGNARPTGPYVPGTSPNMDNYPGGPFSQPNAEYQLSRSRFQNAGPGQSQGQHPQNGPLATSNDWVNSFNGLSLNSQ